MLQITYPTSPPNGHLVRLKSERLASETTLSPPTTNPLPQGQTCNLLNKIPITSKTAPPPLSGPRLFSFTRKLVHYPFVAT